MLNDYLLREQLHHLIDYTLLQSFITHEQITLLCNAAVKYNVNAVCIPPYYVFSAKNLLEAHAVKIITPISYPMGYSTTSAKVEAIKRACNDGADELEVMVNTAAIKNEDWTMVQSDIDSTRTICRLRNKTFRLLIEMSLLESEEWG